MNEATMTPLVDLTIFFSADGELESGRKFVSEILSGTTMSPARVHPESGWRIDSLPGEYSELMHYGPLVLYSYTVGFPIDEEAFPWLIGFAEDFESGTADYELAFILANRLSAHSPIRVFGFTDDTPPSILLSKG